MEETAEERHRFYLGRLHRAAWPAFAQRSRYALRQCNLRGRTPLHRETRCAGEPGTALNYGGHPYHHLGMPGTVIVREHVARNDDRRHARCGTMDSKQLIVNNHGQLWLESVVQEFQKRYQLPGIFRVIDWHRGVREFFRPDQIAVARWVPILCTRTSPETSSACCCILKWWI